MRNWAAILQRTLVLTIVLAVPLLFSFCLAETESDSVNAAQHEVAEVFGHPECQRAAPCETPILEQTWQKTSFVRHIGIRLVSVRDVMPASEALEVHLPPPKT